MLDLSPSTRAERVFQTLEQEIVSGRLPMGAKLGEEALATRYGVSRGPLREALQRLEGRSLVVRAPHSGMRVVSLDLEDFRELYEVRENLEGLATRLATERMTDEEIRALELLLEEKAGLPELNQDTAYAQGFADEDFHFRIAMGSKSRRLSKLLCEDLYSLIRLCRFKTWSLTGQRKSLADHSRIVEAIRARDAELAELLMRRHVAAARQRFLAAGLGRGAPNGSGDGGHSGGL